jgi:chromosome partitioning protein
MKKISFYCKKGGVGKTSLAVIIAHYIATRFKEKTVVVDADPQGNATEGLKKGSYINRYQLLDVINGKVSVKEALSQYNDNLFFIKTDGNGSELREDSDIVINKRRYFFEDLNEEFEKQDFKFVFYDLSPNLGILEKGVIISLDEIISPFIPEQYGISSLSKLASDLIKLNKYERCSVTHKRVVINNKNASIRSHEIVGELFKVMQYKLYTIPQDAKIKDSQFLGKPLYDVFPKSKSMPIFAEISKDIYDGALI